MYITGANFYTEHLVLRVSNSWCLVGQHQNTNWSKTIIQYYNKENALAATQSLCLYNSSDTLKYILDQNWRGNERLTLWGRNSFMAMDAHVHMNTTQIIIKTTCVQCSACPMNNSDFICIDLNKLILICFRFAKPQQPLTVEVYCNLSWCASAHLFQEVKLCTQNTHHWDQPRPMHKRMRRQLCYHCTLVDHRRNFSGP